MKKKLSFLRYFLVIIPVILVILIAGPLRRHLTLLAGLNPDDLSAKTIPQAEGTSTPVPGDIQVAVEKAIAQLKQSDQGYALYDAKVDNVVVAEDGKKAVVWLAPVDPDTGQIIAREPDFAIAELPEPDPKNPKAVPEWSVTLQQQAGYDEKASEIPADLWGGEGSEMGQQKTVQTDTKGIKFGGYYLPWGGGLSKQVTWSIAHTSCANNACHYAFDFADGTNFPLMAAKGGEVFAAKWDCNNGSTSCTNYFIIKDQSTNPVSYQIYYHLAKSSIPTALRSKGALVNQGQFIGNADDTGASTASHLHFMVHTNPNGYWGTSVDITFKDVKINWDAETQGGRPRTPAEAKKYGGEGQSSYVSGNSTAGVPSAQINTPAFGEVITSQNMVVTGTATDDLGITRVQLLANYDGTWKEIGPSVTTPTFSIPVDVCAAGAQIPDGVFSLAVRAWDQEGNQTPGTPGMRQVVKKYPCASASSPVVTPACVPGTDQIALYTGTNYTGSCKVFKTADYVNKAAVKNFILPDAASILLGSNVQVTLFSKASYLGRAETLVSSDPDLSDNLINYHNTLSMQVRSRTETAVAPEAYTPVQDTALTTQDSITLAWVNRGWANIFTAELTGPAGFTARKRDYSPLTNWSIGSLPAGEYTWRVRGKNTLNGSESGWTTVTFTVTAVQAPVVPTRKASYSDDLEGSAEDWTATGLWKLTTNQAASATHSWWFGDSTDGYYQTFSGTLTSPYLTIPASGSYFLRFNSRYHTESATPYMDQRIVQISVNGGTFKDVYQFYDDPVDTWLPSPAIDLSPYAGKSIQVRFYFNALDSYLDSYEGWYVDDLNISTTAPATGCNEPTANNYLLQATPMNLGESVPGDICPAGDQDFYQFTAKAGQKVTFAVSARAVNSKLDPALTLIAPDGYTILAYNDDKVPYKEKDSTITYTFATDGTYYLKLSPWNFPGAGGSEYFYTLKSYSDTTGPNVSISYPASNIALPNAPINISIGGDDGADGSGIARMVLYYHTSDWTNGAWEKVGEDNTGTDGWSVPFDPRKKANDKGSAFYAQVYDAAGNWSPAAAWNLTLDNTQAPPPAPATEMVPMSATSNINTVLLQWNTTGDLSVIDHYEIQYQKDGGEWQPWPYEVPAVNARYAWFIGEMGSTYGFRMRAVDSSGNGETFPDAAETTIQLLGCTAGQDAYEEDNTQDAAKELVNGADRQNHTFCGQNDEDWLTFTPQQGEMYMLEGVPTSPSAGVIMTAYDKNGNLIQEVLPKALGQSTFIKFTASTADPITLQLRNFNPLIAGDGVTYQVYVDQGEKFYIPLVTP